MKCSKFPVASRFLISQLTLAALLSPGLYAEEPPERAPERSHPEAATGDELYLRVRRNERGEPTSMETSVVRYAANNGSGLVVDLIGAVHVADRGYYKKLNERFKQYDALLYELVAPEGTRIPRGGAGGSRHPIGSMQQTMKSILELAYQLEEVDYTRSNFVHADMSPAEFAKSMEDRGESFLQMMFRMMGQAMAMQSKNPGGSSDAQVLFALFAPDRSLRLKRIMAEQFEDLEGAMEVFQGPDGSTLITERNRKALDVLRGQIDAGKKTIGVFYGTGHLPDMAKRLEGDFNLTREKVSWLEAWNMRSAQSRENHTVNAHDPSSATSVK